jgi:hypothetical protein
MASGPIILKEVFLEFKTLMANPVVQVYLPAIYPFPQKKPLLNFRFLRNLFQVQL